jgi:hypothetical protein
MTKFEMVLARLSIAGMGISASKSKFFAEQIEYLNGFQPINWLFTKSKGY